jgi:site-specific DNA-cytosine methylase
MLISNSKTQWSEGVRDGEDPSFAITNQSGGRLKDFICEGSAAGEDNKFTMPIRMEDEPIFTQRATQNNPRAFVVDCQLAGDPDTDRGLTIRVEVEPMFTITASQQKRIGRAFIMGKTADKFGDGIRYAEEPVQTITANEHGSKGFSSGRVVAMTPRCLARFQSFPDHYVLPESKTLACKGIGNAVPPLGYAKIIKPLLEYI